MTGFLDHAMHATPIVPTLPTAAGGGFVTYMGDSISGTISGMTAHTWVDDAQGLFHTATDLNAEWVGYYQQMIEGHASSLSPTQRMEAQAEAVFTFTGLGHLPSAQQQVIREDVQRQVDAIGAAMTLDQISATQPLTAQTYLEINQTLLTNPVLQELGVQGHGLNKPPLARYNGYTIDAQKVTDQTTRYVGPGPDHGEKAVQDFMDDAIMTHIIYPVVAKNGHLVQLNQNGQREESLTQAVQLANMTMFGKLLTESDFKA